MDNLLFRPYIEAAKERGIPIYVWRDQNDILRSTINFWMIESDTWVVCTPEGNVLI